MNNNDSIDKDERTTAIENASYSLGYKVLAFSLLFDVAYRSLKLGESSWDLLGIIIFSGLVLTAYQARHQILTRTWARTAVFAFALAFVVAIVALVTRLF